jgi:putative oxidoreductase
MMITHGWPKLMKYHEYAGSFYNFMGLGTEFSLILTVFAELFCSLLLVVGLWTRLILVPLIILALVIAFVVHGPDPFGDKEHGLLFLVPFLTLMFTGPGRYSLDQLIFSKPVRIPI